MVLGLVGKVLGGGVLFLGLGGRGKGRRGYEDTRGDLGYETADQRAIFVGEMPILFVYFYDKQAT